MIRKKCSPNQLLVFTANLKVQLIGMEPCSGSHLLGRALREQGHEVRLMPAQNVKANVQTNKTDFLDVEAIAEAVQRSRMRFVPIKTEEANRGGQPDPQPSAGTRPHGSQRPTLCGSGAFQDFGRRRVEIVGPFLGSVGSPEIGTRANHLTQLGTERTCFGSFIRRNPDTA